MRRIDHKIAYLLILVVFLGTGSVFAAKYIVQTKNDATAIKDQFVEEVLPAISEAIPQVDESIKEQIASAPPKHSTKQTVTTSGQVTTIVPSGISPNEYPLINCTTGSTPANVPITDETGRYPALGVLLKDYLSRLRWGGEIGSLCGIYVTDAGDNGWSGQYIASYMQSGGGDITSAKGNIILNASYYSHLSQATFNEYMKLILSHEYGHHYSLYHKWVDLDLPMGVRFPDQYYTVRPLSKSATTVDCTTSWSTCESEIVAEDYSYLYSGYGLQQMASLFGYPSAATKTWFDSLTNATTPTPTPEPTPPPTPEPTNENTNTAPTNTNSNANANTNTSPADTVNPVISITEPMNPYAWDATVANLVFKIRSTDNVGVTKVKVYINDQYQGEWAAANINLSWAYDNAPAGTYVFKAEALDAAGNIGEISITINKS